MFEGVNEVPWARLGYWPDGPESVPELLREIAAAPPGGRGASPVWRLSHGLFHSFDHCEVFGAAPHLVPYLLDVARIARQPHRELVVDLLTDIARAQPAAYPDAGPEPDHAALARAAMAARADTLSRLLGDASPKVVVAVARLLAYLPEAAPSSVPALRARAEKGAQDNKGTRPAADAGAVACVLAVAWLAAHDHAQWFAHLLQTSTAHRDLRAAAAAGLAMADPAAEPDNDAIKLIADAHADPRSAFERISWHGDGITTLGSALLRAEQLHRALAHELLARPEQWEIDQGLATAREAIWHWRAAPVALLPAIADRGRDLISAPPPSRHRRGRGQEDPLVDAIRLIADSGQAAAAHADLLAAMLTGDPAERWPEAATLAVEGLGRLGDDRCVPWLTAALADTYGHARHLDLENVLAAMVTHADALMPALQTFFDPTIRGGLQHVSCMDALVSWGAAAAPLVPTLLARFAETHSSSALPLLAAIGPAAADAVPHVRALLEEEHFQGEAAWALWRITGDAGQALELLVRHIACFGGHTAAETAPLLEEFGPAAAIAVPVLRKHLHDAEAGHVYDRVAIARALWAITGQTEGLITPMLDAITTRPLPDRGHRGPATELRAVQALGMIGPAAVEAVPALHLIAHGRGRVTHQNAWADERYQHAARRALTAIMGEHCT